MASLRLSGRNSSITNMAARPFPRPTILPEPPRVSAVPTSWLAERLTRSDLRVVDVRAPGATPTRRGRGAPHARGYVPGAVVLDVRAELFDRHGDVVSGLELARLMSSLGVGDEHTVVVVDEGPSQTLARAAVWALARYGHHDVHVLDGGHTRWMAEGRPVEHGVARHPAASFTARVRPS